MLRGVGDFLGALQEDHANLAARELSRIIAAVRRERFDDQLARALTLRKAVVAP